MLLMAGVTHPVGALTRAIFQFGLRSGILTEEWQALELAYEVLINSTYRRGCVPTSRVASVEFSHALCLVVLAHDSVVSVQQLAPHVGVTPTTPSLTC